MKRRPVTVTARGWFLFCPIWLPAGWEKDDALCPIPRWGLWWVLDAAFAMQQAINWVLSFVDDDLCGYGATVKPIPPRTIRLRADLYPNLD